MKKGTLIAVGVFGALLLVVLATHERGSVNVGVPKGSLQFTAGKTRVYNDTGGSGMPVYRHFCGDCGSPIFSDVVASPQLDWLKAGTLDDTSWVKPVARIWCESAQPWVAYPEGMPRFPQNPPSA